MSQQVETFKNQAAQGDLHICRIDALPDDDSLKPMEKTEGDEFILAHSETGHHHVMAARNVQAFRSGNPLIMFIVVKDPALLEHRRSYDTHASIQFEPGVYKLRRQQERLPEGWRTVVD